MRGGGRAEWRKGDTAGEEEGRKPLRNLHQDALWVISSPLHPIQVLAQAPVALEEGRV